MQLSSLSLKDYIDILSAVSIVVGFPITIFSIYASSKNTQRSIDVQVATGIAMRFQDKWDARWRELLRSGVAMSERQSDVEKDEFYSLLNWVDWLGVLIRRKAFDDASLVLDTIGVNLKEGILMARDTLNAEGKEYWPGVFEVARRLRLIDRQGAIKGSV